MLHCCVQPKFWSLMFESWIFKLLVKHIYGLLNWRHWSNKLGAFSTLKESEQKWNSLVIVSVIILRGYLCPLERVSLGTTVIRNASEKEIAVCCIQSKTQIVCNRPQSFWSCMQALAFQFHNLGSLYSATWQTQNSIAETFYKICKIFSIT